MKISVVTPLYKSSAYIERLHARAVAAIADTGAVEHEIILVNDQSPENDLEVAKRIAETDPGVIVIDLARNVGQHKAILTGLAHATGDFVFVMDSDLDEPPEWITLFYTELRRTGSDVAFGVQQEMQGRPLYKFGRHWFYVVLNALSAIKFPKNVVTARIMSRRYVDALLQYEEREVFLAGIWHMVGFAQCPVSVVKRQDSPTTYSMGRVIGLFINAVTAFSTRPLIAIAMAGIILSIVAFSYSGWVILQKVVRGVAIPGWASVMAVTLVIGGITLLCNGIMAIYLAKVFIEVKRRPISTIRDIFRAPAASAASETDCLGGPNREAPPARHPASKH